MCMLSRVHTHKRCVCTSTSIWFEASSILLALNENFIGNGSKVNRFDQHIVGGFKWIQVDSMSAVDGV